ncbi:MAG: FtsX-like permease family protein [Oligoflexales bacterium]|nr:FtsX-like permease family protein [Oligoflexales bacterium]
MSGKWKMALKNLARNKNRNFATGVAISFGFAALLIMGGYYNWSANLLRVFTIYISKTGHIVIYKKDGVDKYLMKPWKYSLDTSDQDVIKEVVSGIDNVELQGGKIFGTGLIGNGCSSFPFMASGVDLGLEKAVMDHPEVEKWMGELKQMVKGKGRDPYLYPAELNPISVSDGLARLLGKTLVHDEISQAENGVVTLDCMASNIAEKISSDANVQLVAGAWTGMMSAIDAEIVAQHITGVVETEDTHLLISLSGLQRLYDTPNIASYSVWLKDPGKIRSTIEYMKNRFESAGKHFDVYKWDDKRASSYYPGAYQFLIVLSSFITTVLLCVIVFSIFNSVTITTLERSQEIGMMRSFGYSRMQIRKLFVMEMMLLAVFFIVVGSIIGGLCIYLINSSKIPYNSPGFTIQMWLRLKPDIWISALSVILLFVLVSITTFVAVRAVTNNNIRELLTKAER